jgi:hypothetical protein
MTPDEKTISVSPSDKDMILSALETDQLALRKQPIARRKLTRAEVVVLWSLRVYLIFMVAVVVYQAWAAAH